MPTNAHPELPPLELPHIDEEAISNVRQHPISAQDVYKSLFDNNNEEFALELRRQLLEIEDLDERGRAAIIVFGALQTIHNQQILEHATTEAQMLTPEHFMKSEP